MGIIIVPTGREQDVNISEGILHVGLNSYPSAVVLRYVWNLWKNSKN